MTRERLEFYGEVDPASGAIWLVCPTSVFLIGVEIKWPHGRDVEYQIGFELHVYPNERTQSFRITKQSQDGVSLIDYMQVCKPGKTFRLAQRSGLLRIEPTWHARFCVAVEDPPDCCVRHRLVGFDLNSCAGTNPNREVSCDVQVSRH